MELLGYLNSIPRYKVEELVNKEIAINCISIEEFNEVQDKIIEYNSRMNLSIRKLHEVNYAKSKDSYICLCLRQNEWREHELAAFKHTTDLVFEYDSTEYFEYTLHHKIIRVGDIIYGTT